MEMCDSLSNVQFYEKGLLPKDKEMSGLPKKIKRSLIKESHEWDAAIGKESPQEVERQLDKADFFEAPRPPRRPVSIRLDPHDISMIKRIARLKGIPHTTLMALWLHEKVEQERKEGGV
jgi:hypothetical protein